MLSIFTLSALGGFGVSNALTDVAPRAEPDTGPDPEGRPTDAGTGLGGDTDLLTGMDLHDPAARGSAWADPTPPPAAKATPEDLALLSEGIATEPTETTAPSSGDAAPEVIALAVGLPGTPEADLAEPAAAGFRTALGPGDELTLNIAPDLPGRVLAVHATHDMAPGEERVDLSCSLNFYILPPGVALPDAGAAGPEPDFIAAHGLTKLGEVDMGRFAAELDPRTGEVVVTADTRQSGPPSVLVNRELAETSARFL
jgi:hypothetical protein